MAAVNNAVSGGTSWSHGAIPLAQGSVRFRLWAPAAEAVELVLHETSGERRLRMHPTGEGWHELTAPEAGPGTRYSYRLPDGMIVPDPASRFQPEDVKSPGEVIDHNAFPWKDQNWRGRPWHEAVVYELHIGTFTPEGTFKAAIARLPDLAAMGITAIEIMPIADFPGLRNWGYDGVLLYAPDSSYGRPEDLKELVQAAHAQGIMVLLDCVYNHFGPEGNYLAVYAPAFFTDRHKTPWGAAVNYDGPHAKPVREFVVQNAIHWITEYHLDGLRLDAVHAIIDDSPEHILAELARRVRAAAGDRHVHLVLENEENLASRLQRNPDGTPKQFTAQWNDDVHHVLHVAATGEDAGYYREYSGDTGKLGKALAEGFAFQGQMMKYKGGTRGEPSAGLPPTAFVAFIQNHDQVGNRAFGDRIGAIAKPEAVKAIASIYLLLPQVPMLFMGEEWNAAQPFPFFCDFHGELAEAVRKGRREEFARFPEFQDPEKRERIPDPQAEATFASAKLDWNARSKGPHAQWLDFYRSLLKVRHEAIVKLIPGIGQGGSFKVIGDGAVEVQWRAGQTTLTLCANLSDRPVTGFSASSGQVLWQQGEPPGPWSVRWTLSSRDDA